MRRFCALLLFFSLLPIGIPILAQHAFQIVLPGMDHAAKRPAVQTPDGGFCVLGITHEAGSPDSRMALVKTTADGNVEWGRQLFTSGKNDNPVALRQTADGGFIVLAVTSIPESWDQDILVLKLSTHGDPVWSRSYNYSVMDWANDLTLLEDGSVVIVGATEILDSLQGLESEGYSEEYGETPVIARQHALVFRIDPEGEVLWGRYIDKAETSIDPEAMPVERSYAQALCTRRDNTITLIAQRMQGNEIWSSFILNITDQGKAQPSLWMRSAELDGSPLYSPFANDIAPLPDGGCILAGVARFYDFNQGYAATVNLDQGFLLRLNTANETLWHRTYTFTQENPLPLSVAPLDEDHYAIAGRTLFTRLFDTESPGLYDDDNPIIAVTDRTGKPIEARQWKTSFQGIPGIGSDEEGQAPYLWWPAFTATEDQGLLAVGIIRKPVPAYEYEQSRIGLSLTRFNPDLTTCGNNQTEPATIHSAPATATQPRAESSYYSDWDPVDVSPYDLRRPAAYLYDSATPEIVDSDRDTTAKGVEAEANLYGEQIEEADTYDEGEAEEEVYEESDYAAATDDDVLAEYIENGGYGADEYSVEEEDGTDEDGVTDYGSDEHGYGDSEPSDTIALKTDGEYVIPPIVDVEITLGELHIGSQIRSDLTVENFEITPWFLCGENALAGTTSSAPTKGTSVETEYLRLLPNSIRKGKNVAVEFALSGTQKPEVELVTVGRGEAALHLDAKSIAWSSAGGIGSTTIETAGLAAGVYLVRVRSGEKQLTAKLNVQ